MSWLLFKLRADVDFSVLHFEFKTYGVMDASTQISDKSLGRQEMCNMLGVAEGNL
jgi:hypothetical protein